MGGLTNKNKYHYTGSVSGRYNTECIILKIFEKGDYVDIMFLDGFKITTSVTFVK